MYSLDEIKLSIPPLWEKGHEWASALEEVEPEEKQIVKLQTELSRILKYADGRDPAPEVIAWLVLWTRAFQGLNGLRGAVLRRSLLTCRVLERALFESALHLMTIARPAKGGPKDSLPETRDVGWRLRAYLAWCLWNDAEEWRKYLNPSNLDVLYDPRPAREYARTYGQAMEALGGLLGEVETFTDAEAEQERIRDEQAARKRLAVLEHWLADRRLKEAVERLKQLTSKRKYVPTFFEVVNEKESSVRRALEAQGMVSGYSIYARASSALHGSSLETILWTHLPALGPQIWATDEDLRERVGAAVTWGQSCTLGLFLIRPNG